MHQKDRRAALQQLLAFPFGLHYNNKKFVEQNGWIVSRNNNHAYDATNEVNVLNQIAEGRRIMTNALNNEQVHEQRAHDNITRSMNSFLNRGFIHLENVNDTRLNELGLTITSKGTTTHVADILPGFIPGFMDCPEVSQMRSAKVHHPARLISSLTEDVSLFKRQPYRSGDYTVMHSHTIQKFAALSRGWFKTLNPNHQQGQWVLEKQHKNSYAINKMTGDRTFDSQAKDQGKIKQFTLNQAQRETYYGKTKNTYRRVSGNPYISRRDQGPFMGKSETLIDQEPGSCWPTTKEEANHPSIAVKYEEISYQHARLLNHPEQDALPEESMLKAKFYWSVPPDTTCQVEHNALPESMNQEMHDMSAKGATGSKVWTTDGRPVSAGPK